jgi:dethiobiotin synthetase
MVDDDRALRCAVLGSDTGVGKSTVLALLCAGLRARGRRVWLHKPVACGGWAEGQAEDGREIAGLVADGQDPASACPWQFPLAAAPHVAARAAGVELSLADLLAGLRPLLGVGHDLLLEGVGGVLAPLTSRRESVVDLLRAEPLPVILVTRPQLGTLNHSALSVRHLRERGLTVLGLVVNEHVPVDHGDPAIACAAEELAACCQAPLLAWLPHAPDPAARRVLAETLIGQLLPSGVAAC